MNESGVNNITKSGAIQWWGGNFRKYPTEQLIDLIYRVTVCGEEYVDSGSRDPSMSYICRLFNVTAYGASKQQNRIKGRYAKYRNKNDIRSVIANIVRQNPNGFQTESPRFDDLLKDYYSTNTAYTSQPFVPEKQYQTNRVRTQEIKTTYDSGMRFSGHSSGSGEYSGTEVVYVLAVFCIALLIRWFFSGTLWGAWYRKILTILAVIFGFCGGVAVFAELGNLYDSSKKGKIVFMLLMALGLAVYSVCHYPGHWISRIITAVLSFCICCVIDTVSED